jgi:outer membrane protein assembly factor BamA
VHVGGSLIWSTLPTIDKARRQQAYKIFAEAPRLGDGNLGVLASAYFVSASEPYRVAGEENDPNPALHRSYDYSRVGGIVGVTFPVLPELELGVDYRFETIDALLPEDPVYDRPGFGPEPVDLALEDDRHRLTAAHFGVTWDGRRQAFATGKGGRIGLDLSLSSPALGSEYEYVKLVAAGAYTMRLPWGHWLTPIAQGGQIAGRAPVFERFYSGDLSDWTPGREQALRFSTRNPIDVFGTRIDTRTFGVIFGRFDLEYVWPLFRRTRTRGVYGGDLVLSAGVFTLVEDRATRAARRDRGELVAPVGFNADFGLRLDTAVGTVSLTVGNVLRRTPL